jgi:hypothetical protein
LSRGSFDVIMAGMKAFITALLLAWYALFLLHPVDLTTADLGRHIKNGEMILQGHFEVLNANTYSYTQPGFPVINHHWGSGVVFFLIHKFAGFSGLSIFYILASPGAFLLLFRLTEEESGSGIAVPVSLLLIPLIAERFEIRPEVFSYFFSAVFFWILWHYKAGKRSELWLFLLPILQFIWVNLHIYFILGPALIGIFLVSEFAENLNTINIKVRKLGFTLFFTIFACLLNPFGLKGALAPLKIFENYGYRLVENQSVRFLDKLGLMNPNLMLFKIAFAVLFLSFVLVLITNRRNFSIIYLFLGAVLGTMAWLALRNLTIFGLFALPIISYNIKQGLTAKIRTGPYAAISIILLSLVIFASAMHSHYHRLYLFNEFPLGLKTGVNSSAEFFIGENLRGPVLNNYDIGGYLIYHLYPREKVFVDNRPEAYPASFFKDIYVPLQESRPIFKEQDMLHHFNAIFFSWHDATPWGQKFIIDRVSDPAWAPVFADQYAIIFLKRNKLNSPIIQRYEISKDHFSVIKTK